MPVTRSQKGSSPKEQSPETVQQESSTTEATSYETYETSGTGTTHETSSKETATLKGKDRRAASTKSTRRVKELEARAELAERELKEAQAATAAAKIRLELIQASNEEEDSVIEEPVDREENVQEWVQATVERISAKGHPEQAPIEKIENAPTSTAKPEEKIDSTRNDNRKLAEAIVKAIRDVPHRGQGVQPEYMHHLPAFDGDSREWIAFKAVYEDTAPLFSDAQNMARLRRALRGSAREGVESQLYSEATPGEIIEALKRRYGRADALVLAELEKIRNLPKIRETAHDICALASSVSNTVATIRGLKKPQYLLSPEILRSITDKMPPLLKFRWYDYIADKADEDQDLNSMGKFLNKMADRCGPHATQETVDKRPPMRRQAAHTTVDRIGMEKPPCPHCREEHYLNECSKYLQAPTKMKWQIAKESRLCYKCLQGRHRKESCKRPPCPICKRWHHKTLHYENKPEEPKQENTEVANNVRLPANNTRSARAYLKMIPVEIYGPTGSKKVLALLDEGSTVTLLDSSIAAEIGLDGPKEALRLETVGGKSLLKKDSMKLNMKIRGLHHSRKRSVIGARTIDDMRLTPQALDEKIIKRCTHLKKIADQLSYREESPKLLIGQDNWALIVSRTTRKGRRDQPVASLTDLGWVLHGYDGGAAKMINFVTCAHVVTSEEKIEKMIKDHFAIESLGVQPKHPSTDMEARALKILNETSHRLSDGRYEVGLVWKNDNDALPDNYKSAESRLKGVERKLDRDAGLKKEYEEQIENLLKNGYAEKVEHASTSTRKWYLPHFAVTHPTKGKKRIVFDAAAKFGGKSLNDLLLPGPDLLQSLFGVLLRFRQGAVAVVADIKEMFLQIRIRPEDRDSLRFLWRGGRRSGALNEYRMTSVIFGAACSPSAAIFVKNKNAADYQHQYPEAVQAIEHNHYMDDYLQSFDSEDQAAKIASEVDAIHKQAKFTLRGWASNRTDVVRRLAPSTGPSEVELGSKEEKTLGMRWFTAEDEVGFRTNLRESDDDTAANEAPTKRQITSAVMSTFDPMGIASPVLIQGKALIQSVWRSGVDWDEAIVGKDIETWKSYVENLRTLKNLRVPRCFTHSNTEGELHVFTDASESAYACAAYWRERVSEGHHHVALLAGKARVTPLRPVSIPRLELQAALLGTRMARSIEEELSVRVTKKTYWTDSSTVLSWIKSDPRSFKPFVAHRLAEIEDTSKPQEWRWVPTSQNPADDATRKTPRGFDADHRWFNGPAFLRREEDSWPEQRTVKIESTGEEKDRFTIATLTTSNEYPTPDPERFSSWRRLWRATARVLQFIALCRARKEATNVSKKIENNDPTWRITNKKKNLAKIEAVAIRDSTRLLYIDATYLEKAEKLLLKRSQWESFGKSALTHEKLRKFDVIAEDDLLRVRGRIDAATCVGSEFRRPVILDGRHVIAKLLIKHYHDTFNHGNHATVMNEIRQRYWILGLRSAVRAAAHRCQWCRVYRSKPRKPPTGNLPRERLRHGEPPFTCTGVDYFGPMTVTIGRRREKRWGALFTCLTTRAVHIELVATLSTDSTILALRRMAARRGMPKVIYSDNGSNFVSANKELQEAANTWKIEDIAVATERLGVRWKFIPPGAPNMGGAWERLVRSIKTALAVTLKERHPQEEVLHTLLLEAEHVVNSRPLTVNEDNEEEEALTPNHFLIGRSCASSTLGAFTDEDLSGRRTWKAAQRMADHFWSRWVKEYLPTLLPRKARQGTDHRDLRRGDTVLIVDSTLPRNTWPRGEVIRTYPGPDGRVRIVEVRTPGGILKRPSSKAVLLVPASEDEHGSEQPGAMEAESPRQGVGAAHEGEDVGDRSNEH